MADKGSQPKPPGLKQPSRIARPSGLPLPRSGQGSMTGSTNNLHSSTPANSNRTQNASSKPTRGVGFSPQHADYYTEQTSRFWPGPESPVDNMEVDDFKIGDRVWVSGTRPGVVAFVGETQFAPGDWAGVVLDDAIGKNDGSVMGVRYFLCEPKRGVFSRLSKLSHTQKSPSMSHESESKVSDTDLRLAATGNGALFTPSRPSSRLGLSAGRNLSTSSSSLHRASSAGVTPTGASSGGIIPLRLPSTTPGGVRVGDRVIVGGSKAGVLRYIGETDFAKGVWAGVELDEPLGKNDGAVAGKRYFDCKPLHGLFAPVHKIARAGSLTSTPSPHSRPLMSTSLRSSRDHSGSQESILSLSSTASSVSRSRVRLGVTSLANQSSKSGQRPSTLNLTATTTALQKTLKEKEEHIEQLLRERDLERSEVARAAAHVDEAEGQLSSMRVEQERLRKEAEDQIGKYRALASELESEKQELLAFLEEEKRKVEDLQFQLEEATLKDDEDETKADSVDEQRLTDLEKQARQDKERADRLEKDLQDLKKKLADQVKATEEASNSQTSLLEQIEELTYKLSEAETTLESSRLEDGSKTSQVNKELAEKQNKIRELEEQLSAQNRELSSMAQQLNDVREELTASNDKRKKQEDSIQELASRLKRTEEDNRKLVDQLHSTSSSLTDLQRQLAAGQEKAEELSNDRNRLEIQLSELVKNSGNSSSHLEALNEQLAERSRRIQDLQSDLSKSSQHLAKSEEAYHRLKLEKDRESQEAGRRSEERIGQLTDEITGLNSAIERYKARLSQLSDSVESEKQKVLEQKELEIQELKQRLAQGTDQLNNLQQESEGNRQALDRITAEKAALLLEKQQVEEQLARRGSDDTEVVRTKEEVARYQQEVTRYQEEVARLEVARLEVVSQVERLSQEVELAQKTQEEAEKSREDLKSQGLVLTTERDSLQHKLAALEDVLQTKEAALVEIQRQRDELEKESSRTAVELMQKSQSETDFVKEELDALQILLQETQGQLKTRDEQIYQLRVEVEHNRQVASQTDLLVQEKSELVKEREALEAKCRSLVKEIKKQSDRTADMELEVQTLQLSEAALRKEKSSLEGRVGQLQTDLDKAKIKEAAVPGREGLEAAAAPAGDQVYSQLREEAASAQGQVDFLNSVIVELQNKNQELMHRLSAMEDSGIHTNGEFSEPLETPSRSRPPLRLFCDICDVFDLHDTEDCPKQAMSQSPEPSRHHGDPKNARPYCDICEVFGHWTSQCDDEQTF